MNTAKSRSFPSLNFTKEKPICILSIDGGGVRGIIPAIILQCLEENLQEEARDENVKIADYFDVIAGTSAGGLITAMLTAPDKNNTAPDENKARPKYSSEDIVKFFREKSIEIFPPRRGLLSPLLDIWKPKYDGERLREIVEEELGGTKLSETVTNIVIPTFDLKERRPRIFSSLKSKTTIDVDGNAVLSDTINRGSEDEDVKLSDICIGTTAAPTYLPPHSFPEDNPKFSLIDGGVIANNPALIAISEGTRLKPKPSTGNYKLCWGKRDGTQRITRASSVKYIPSPNEYAKIYLVSLGTGFLKANPGESKPGILDRVFGKTRDPEKWGKLSWGAGPFIELSLAGSQDMVDYHLHSIYRTLCPENYIRIQTDKLNENTAQLDCATPENLAALETLANNILDGPVQMMNLETFKLENDPNTHHRTCKEALKGTARRLHSIKMAKEHQQDAERRQQQKQEEERQGQQQQQEAERRQQQKQEEERQGQQQQQEEERQPWQQQLEENEWELEVIEK